MADERSRQPPADRDAYILQVRRANGDAFHSFASMEEAAAFALDVLRAVMDGQTYPLAIWHHDRKLWKPTGRQGKLHMASTRDALESLARRKR